jgi:hypothetical protein
MATCIRRTTLCKIELERKGVLEPEPPSLKFAIPILEVTSDENGKELCELLARLFAAAIDQVLQ